MVALLVGLVGGLVVGLLYLVSRKPTVRRTLASSTLLGIVVGIVVELTRRPFLTAIFAGVATIVLAEFIRWIVGSMKRRA